MRAFFVRMQCIGCGSASFNFSTWRQRQRQLGLLTQGQPVLHSKFYPSWGYNYETLSAQKQFSNTSQTPTKNLASLVSIGFSCSLGSLSCSTKAWGSSTSGKLSALSYIPAPAQSLDCDRNNSYHGLLTFKSFILCLTHLTFTNK